MRPSGRSRAVIRCCTLAGLLPTLVAFLSTAAQASIVTNTYTTTNLPTGSSNPDGAYYPSGTVASVAIMFDDAITYVGGPDITTRTPVSIPGGLRVTIGADVFTADNYFIDYYNAGPGRATADLSFHTGLDFFSLLPVLHNGSPTGTAPYFFPVQLRFNFYGVSNNIPMPNVPGLSFPMPPYIGEGFVRDYNNGGEYTFPQESWSQVPAPGSAAILGLGGLGVLITPRRRR